jgi:hypothetical protein
MTPCSVARSSVATVAVALAVLCLASCKRGGPPGLPLGTAGGDTGADARAAGRWIEGLRAGDAGALAAQAHYPFDLRDTRAAGQKGRCESGVLGDADAMKKGASCLMADALLKGDLAANPAPRIVAMSTSELAPWAKPWAGEIRPGLRLMSVFIHGTSSAYELIVLVGDDGVHGFWENVSIDPA